MQNQQKYIDIAKKIKILILDVDGVMTDNGIYVDCNGNELKKFNALDGHGIKILMYFGIEIAIISGRTSPSVTNRAKELGIKYCYQGMLKKSEALADIINKTKLGYDEAAYMGDDIIDLSVMQKVALPIAVANAQKIVRDSALLITNKNGGNAAVREVCDYLLKSQGKYDKVIDFYTD